MKRLLESALQSPVVEFFVERVWWPFYDGLIKIGEIHPVDNTDVSADWVYLLAVVGLVFSGRGVIPAIRRVGLDQVVRDLKGGRLSVPVPWLS